VDPAREAAADNVTEPEPSGPARLGYQYRRAIELAESLAQNQPGADKTWVEESLREYRAHYSRASRVR
jgi:hypothetical protein